MKGSGETPRAQPQLAAQVVGIAATYVGVWEEVSALLGELDVLAGFAELAACAPTPYVRPTMLPSGEGELVLRGGTPHPATQAAAPGPMPIAMLNPSPRPALLHATAGGTRPDATQDL